MSWSKTLALWHVVWTFEPSACISLLAASLLQQGVGISSSCSATAVPMLLGLKHAVKAPSVIHHPCTQRMALLLL